MLSEFVRRTGAANGIAFIGAIAGMLTIELIGRRKQLIGLFWIMEWRCW